jgi:hypothetical protein
MNLRNTLALGTAMAFGVFGCATTHSQTPAKAGAAVVATDPVPSRNLAEVAPMLVGGGRTLLVLDIDDTLLTSPQFYGSDDWFGWQRKEDTPAGSLVPCPYLVIAINTELGSQKPSQPDAPTIINPLMHEFDTIMLTSRNPGARVATLRELRLANYEMPRQLDGKAEGISYRFRNPRDPKAATVTVTYDQGLFMTEGQDKGEVLVDLLNHHMFQRYDRVVLVDDGKSNHTNMQRALAREGIEYRGLHYLGAKKETTDAAKAESDAAWKDLMSTMEKIFPERAMRFAAECKPTANLSAAMEELQRTGIR